jgi:hypothetical protein
MTIRTATCRCGQLRARCTGEPIRVSVCHCIECQKRSGSVFAVQARWLDQNVRLKGDFKEWSRTGDSEKRATYRFCANCGATVTYSNKGMPAVTAVPVGAFADPDFPPPKFSVYEERKHLWVTVAGDDTRVTELRNMGMQSRQVKAFLAMSAEMQDRVYAHSNHEDLQDLVSMIA